MGSEMEAKLQELEARLAALESAGAGGEDGVLPSRKTGGDAQIMKKVATRLQDFESQITAQLANLQTDFDVLC
ncbi:rihB [Symbiodinium sp. CCMP2592]|nr:rihB [Symbiodinium sp. CCMP2592]